MAPILTFLFFIVVIASLNSQKCGISNEQDGRILGGHPTSTSKYPWMVYLCRQSSFKCGASLIDKEWIITAAHCVAKPDYTAKDYTFFLGIKKRSCSENNAKAYKAANIYVHPNYTKNNRSNDIALIKLSSPASNLDSEDSSNVICLPKPSTIHSYLKRKKCNYTGWGVFSYVIKPEYPLDLLEGVAKLKQCSPPKPNIKKVREEISQTILKICSENPTTSACFGDSGGPLMCYKNNKWQLIGVASAVQLTAANCKGKPNCKNICKLGGYTKFIFIPQYVKWIKDIMKKN